jgi:hypothetical protein
MVHHYVLFHVCPSLGEELGKVSHGPWSILVALMQTNACSVVKNCRVRTEIQDPGDLYSGVPSPETLVEVFRASRKVLQSPVEFLTIIMKRNFS